MKLLEKLEELTKECEIMLGYKPDLQINLPHEIREKISAHFVPQQTIKFLGNHGQVDANIRRLYLDSGTVELVDRQA